MTSMSLESSKKMVSDTNYVYTNSKFNDIVKMVNYFN